MKHLSNLEDYNEKRDAVLTIGKFDGLHRGHQALVDAVNSTAKVNGLLRIMCVVDLTPFWQKNHITPQLLMTKEERRERLQEQMDYIIECPFTDDFMNKSARDFIEEVIVKRFHAKYVVVGEDFHFGRSQSGDTKFLKKCEAEFGFKTIVIPKKKYLDHVISSSYIRNLIHNGEMALANELLGYPYSFGGTVRHGNHIGRTLGFPTLNVYPLPEKVLPPFGVYYNLVEMEDRIYRGIGNLGTKPTVTSNTDVLIETYLFDFDEDAYSKDVRIEMLEFRRQEEKFDSLETMKAHVDQDIEAAKHYFAENYLDEEVLK